MQARRIIAAVAVCALTAAGCSGNDSGQDMAADPHVLTETSQREAPEAAAEGDQDAAVPPPDEPAPSQTVEPVTVSGFFETTVDNLSTFAMDVDTASYTHAQAWIDSGQLPPANTVRPEEFVNYFDYDYPAPDGDQAWGVHVDGGPAPWNSATQLVRIGLNTRQITAEERPDATLTFVVDVSGSMSDQPIATVKETLELLASRMRPTDRIGIVTYGSTASVLLPPTPLSESDSIAGAINALETGGSTYAEEGLRVGYEQARAHMTPNGINTVVLASDGVANVGATGPEAILETIREGVGAGITLLALGVGGNDGYNDHLMETLTNTGNGSSYFVTSREEAERLFVDQLEQTLVVVAKDSKVQVEFDPAAVTRWRLIGYDNRDVADEDFRNDAVDAGEVGAGHEVTALYEVELAEQGPDSLGTVNVRWAHPKSGEVSEVTAPVTRAAVTSGDGPGLQTAVASVAFAEVLRGSPHVGDWTLANVAGLGDSAVGDLVARAEAAHPAP